MIRPPLTSRRRTALPGGFTLTELLVVLFIVALMVGITVPMLGRLTDATRGDAGVTAVSTAVNAARIVGGRTPVRELDGSAYPVPGLTVRDEGTAALFTPSGEIRILRHEPFARDEDGSFLEAADRHGFTDNPSLNYVTVPRWASFAGVRRDENGDLEFVPPPFAVRFDVSGKLRSGGAIYYDGDGDGFDSSRTHANYPNPPYDPTAWDTRDADAPEANHTADGRSALPYDEIPVVTAVVLFEMRKFREDGASWADDWSDGNSSLHAFLGDPERTRAAYFSPQTGLMMRGLTGGARR